MADRLAALGVPADRADILPNYVDTELFKPTSEMTPGSRLVFVGRLAPQKNPHLLVEAARVTGLPLDIVGGGHLLAQTRRLAEGLPVTFYGNQPHIRLPDLIRGALCFLFPSSYEGHPKALLEAMACGLPVVAADRPGIREMIRHGETGLLVEPETASIAAAIRRLQSDSDLCRQLGAQARAFIEAHFSLEGILEAEIALYQKLLVRPARLSAKEEG
jgi:glycosyltransferase involved in cell wall biosynthesis